MPPDQQRSGERQRPDVPAPLRSGEHQRPDPVTATRSSGEHQRPAPLAPKGHLPRLSPEAYRGQSFVHWTLTLEARATGWLSPAFHHSWRHLLLHACARYHLICPCYTLMPDHLHLLWAGTSVSADQRLAIEFLRRQLGPVLAPATWQKQPHDHVLRAGERAPDTFATIANYIFENPVRAGLVGSWSEYDYSGCCVTGYPELDPRQADYWLRFWRVYNYLVR